MAVMSLWTYVVSIHNMKTGKKRRQMMILRFKRSITRTGRMLTWWSSIPAQSGLQYVVKSVFQVDNSTMVVLPPSNYCLFQFLKKSPGTNVSVSKATSKTPMIHHSARRGMATLLFCLLTRLISENFLWTDQVWQQLSITQGGSQSRPTAHNIALYLYQGLPLLWTFISRLEWSSGLMSEMRKYTSKFPHFKILCQCQGKIQYCFMFL